MSFSLEEEQKFVERARLGDDAAFEELILALSAPLYRVVQRLSSDTQETEAVIQETFWRAWRSLDRYKNDRPFFPFLVTIALNLQRDRWRASRWVDERDLESEAGEMIDPQPAPETLVEDEETLNHLTEAVRRLPDMYRAVVSLRYDADMSYEEISETLNLPINTVRTHLRRAKQMLRKMLEQYNG